MDFRGIHLPDKNEPTLPGRKLSEGLNANVYEWGDDRVIKLFKASYPTEKVTEEYYNALAVKRLDFKKAEVLELKKTEVGYGIIFKKLNGETLLDYIFRTRDFKGAAKTMAELQRNINKCKFDVLKTEGLETAHQRLRKDMLDSKKADSDATKEMIRFLGTMKEGDSLCHGNLHPDNVMMTDEGAVALSFSGYCIGKPMYDVARSFFLIAYTKIPDINGNEKTVGRADSRVASDGKLGQDGVDNAAASSVNNADCGCALCRGITNLEERKEFGRHYLDAMGVSATEIGGYLSMIIAGI